MDTAAAVGAPATSTQPAAGAGWRPLDIAAVLCLLAALQVVQATLVLSDRMPPTDSVLTAQVLRFFPTVVTAYVVLVLAWSRGMRPRHLGFIRPRSWRPALYAWAGAVLVGPAYSLVLMLLGEQPSGFAPASIFGASIIGGGQPGIALAASTVSVIGVAPLVEEVIFRGLVFRGARSRWPLIPAAVVAGLLFAAFHFNAGQFVPLFAGGALLAYAYDRSGSLWCAIAPHAGVNAVCLLVVLVAR